MNVYKSRRDNERNCGANESWRGAGVPWLARWACRVFVGCSLLVQFLLLSTPTRAFQQYMEIHYCPTVGSNRLLLIRQL